MTVTLLQPSYLPWLGYFEQMARCDAFVFLDDAQFTHRDWRNRNKVRTPTGWAWLTVPVIQKHKNRQSLLETKIDNSVRWKRKHLQTIRHCYARAACFDLYYPWFEELYSKEWTFLLDICFETILRVKQILKIETPTLKISELALGGYKEDRIIGVCEKLNASRYRTGNIAKNYLSREKFAERDLELEFQNYKHPVYRQRFKGFVPYLSIIDLLFNHGENSLDILTQQNPAQA